MYFDVSKRDINIVSCFFVIVNAVALPVARSKSYSNGPASVPFSELAEQYKQRLLNPASISYQDGDDKDVTWWDERPETSREAAFHLLGTTEESFYGDHLSLHDVHVDLIDIILLPESWTTQDGTMLERIYTDLDSNTHPPLLLQGEGHYTLNNYRVFDLDTRTFVSPR